MIKIKILSIGKTKESWLDTAMGEYFKRLKGQVEFECQWAKSDEQLIQLVEKESSVICLDPAGKEMDSPEFSTFFEKKVEEGGARLTFVIGGAEGLPRSLKDKFSLLSLSRLTFTHQLIRLVLVEQIYRAFTLMKGIPYHK
ncbi:MAG: Ribosomal RNA large subunit methyltransferase H [Chlamydiae bacterium]|nr:Ribosomal RNA large subunit methyltransferase H [Chlamydiota bacterium]